MPKTDFSTTHVAKMAGINYQTLNRWIKDGVITCDVPAEGTGSRRRFTFRDLVLVLVARMLKDFGLTLRAVRSVQDGVRAGWQDQDPNHAGYLAIQHWTDGDLAVWDASPGTLRALLPSPHRVQSSPDTWTGVLFVLDLVFLANRARDRLAASNNASLPIIPPRVKGAPEPSAITTVLRDYRGDESGVPRRVYGDPE